MVVVTTVYTKPACVQCEMTKKYMDKNGIPYTTVDITKDQEAFDMVIGMGFQSAPVVISEVGNWSGFQPDKINLLAA
jgi:glutaredoxin-like protein NrdH